MKWAQLDSLRGAQGVIVGEVGNLEQTVENKLKENEERNDKREQVLETLHTNMQKITLGLGINREATMQINKELVPLGRKMRVLGGNMKSGVMKSANKLRQNYTESATRKETTVRTKLPKMPYLGELK